jgi:hypothetical protein
VFLDYTKGTELRDPTPRELAGHYARLVIWSTRGGFVDELGKKQVSGHHFDIDYPARKFVGLALAEPARNPGDSSRRSGAPGRPLEPIANSYWSLAGSTYAYVFGNWRPWESISPGNRSSWGIRRSFPASPWLKLS